MKLLNFLVRGETRVGAVSPRGVIDLAAAGLSSPMETLIAEWETAGDLVRSMLEDETLPAMPMDELTLAPATRPSKILCVGLNYSDHAAETHGETPKEPAIFCKLPSCAAAHLEPIPIPPGLKKLDHEAELVIIVGKNAWQVRAEEAPAHIFGYTCGNDVSARDAQFRSSQWFLGKTLSKFAPTGPVIVTSDELDVSDLAVTCAVNGEVRQHARTSDMTFSPAEIVAYVSQFIELCPGDQIFTGTPGGVIIGKPKDERVWLTAGDTMTVAIEGIGSLTNTFAE